MKKLRKPISILLAVMLFAVTLSACDWFTESISFTKSSVSMVYGESLDLDMYITISNADSGVFTLSSLDTKVVQVVSNSTVKAVGTGNTTVTARLYSGGHASIKINVDYAAVASVTLLETGELYQSVDSPSAVGFKAVFNEGTDNEPLTWLVNNQPQNGNSSEFTLSPKFTAGEYTVRAQLESTPDIFAISTVRVYNSYELPQFVFGGEDSYDTPTPVSFSFTDVNQDNPEYLYQMYVDGKLAQEKHSHNPTFTFTPASAGIYTVSFKLNGETLRDEGGNQSASIVFKGVVVPYGLSLDFDSDYPSVLLRWKNTEDTLFTVELISGTNYATIENILAKNGEYDIKEYIDVTRNYTIKVKSQDYGYFLASDYVSFQHNAVSSSAISYLNKKYLSGNFYMTSDDEVFDLFDYMLIFRPNAQKVSDGHTSECVVFMGYTSQKSAATFSSLFRDRMTITGMYKWSLSGSTASGKTVGITLTYLSNNQPTNYNTSGKLVHKVLIAPEVSATGWNEPLPVDYYPLSADKITNTNQLFYTLEKGYYPVCEEGSGAQRIFSEARAILLSITDISMNEAEIARAIYDYVMFRVSYDDQVITNTNIDYAVLQPAYYPEGVFDTGFAVCDGISKAFSILCNMMGIKCVRVIGKAIVENVPSGIEHAWNKLMIGGKWYTVDATWGIIKISIGSTIFKAGTHEFFLISDADTLATHIEVGLSYPKTAAANYNWFLKNDKYIFDNVDLQTQASTIVQQILAQRSNKTYAVQGQTYVAEYFAAEYKVSSSLMNVFNDSDNPIINGLSQRGVKALYFVINNTVIIAA